MRNIDCLFWGSILFLILVWLVLVTHRPSQDVETAADSMSVAIDTMEGPADELYYQWVPTIEQQTITLCPDTFYMVDDSILVVKYTPRVPRNQLNTESR